MYQYSEAESQQLTQRALQFKGQVERFQKAQLDPDLFQQLRLRNGLYKEKQAHMLRVAIPYGCMTSTQLHKLADISLKFDKGYGHFTTRQNIQFNWPKLEETPDILLELASVNMHAIQTSGSCIRNISCDHLAGVATDEIADPRPWCEMIRQWANLHPEFNWLPRKFKFAVTGAIEDRAVIKMHDIGLKIIKDNNTNTLFEVYVGGGMGRTPVIAKCIHEALPAAELLPYLQAIIRIYNQFGRRDHKYKSRIKILVNDLGIDNFRNRVEAELKRNSSHAPQMDWQKLNKLRQMFAFRRPSAKKTGPELQIPVANKAYSRWLKHNTIAHKNVNERIVMVSLKSTSAAPGDITAAQMHELANLAEQYSLSEIRASHNQNLVLPHVETQHLYSLWHALDQLQLATPNTGLLTDIIACPGFDFCSLANTTTLDIAAQITDHFTALRNLHQIGEVSLKISGCMNSCGHHHAGNIGILGVDKKGEQWYQLTLGGRADNNATIGTRLGRAIPKQGLLAAIDTIIGTYLENRHEGELFIDCVERIGVIPFQERVYADH